MADTLNNKRKLTPAVVVAIISICAASILSGIIIWQTASIQTRMQSLQQDAKIELKIDNLTNAVNSLTITVATIGQRLDDHIVGARK